MLKIRVFLHFLHVCMHVSYMCVCMIEYRHKNEMQNSCMDEILTDAASGFGANTPPYTKIPGIYRLHENPGNQRHFVRISLSLSLSLQVCSCLCVIA